MRLRALRLPAETNWKPSGLVSTSSMSPAISSMRFHRRWLASSARQVAASEQRESRVQASLTNRTGFESRYSALAAATTAAAAMTPPATSFLFIPTTPSAAAGKTAPA